MTKTMTAIEAHERIAAAASKPLTEVRDCRAMQVGEFARQGDLYVERIAERTAQTQTAQRQLVRGTTQGSRHVASAKPGEPLPKVYELPQDKRTVTDGRRIARLLGPQLVVERECVIEHPEHAHLLLGAGTYQISYQLDAATQRAVRD